MLGHPRSTHRYEPIPGEDEQGLTGEIVELASRYGRYGYRRVTALLRMEGWDVNHKRVERIWRREGLKVPAKQPKRGRLWLNDGSCVRLRPQGPNHVWAYDFVLVRTQDSRAVRLLTVIDEYTRECLAIRADRQIRSSDVIETLAELMMIRGVPDHIRSDNGPEFTARAPSTYRNVTFYLDTPLLVRRLGSEGEVKQAAVSELIDLLKKLDGRVATFSHSRQELEHVLQGAATYLESFEARAAIVFEARRQGTTRSDLLLLAESIDSELSRAGVEVEATPRYLEELQIDETVFEQVLEDSVSYYNPRAKEYDINSVRSIYAIRGDRPAPSLEKARAVFVTSNSAFAKVAWEYGRQHEASQDVSSVITDFTLANTAWLKAPMGAPAVPTTQLLAFSYAALEPSTELLGKYLKEIDRLQAQGTITERDHQLLRSSPLVYSELMHLTLGEDASLTEGTVTETLDRVSSEIRREEWERLTVEQKAHQETRDALNSQQARNQEIVRNLYWRCRGRARALAFLLSVGMVALLAIGLLSGLGLRPAAPIVSWVLMGSSTILTLLTLVNLVFGSSVKKIHAWVQNRCLTWFLKREAKTVGVDLSELITD